jgi:tRNA A-37 threonylcarbamoyl transferase component Bud32
MTSEAQSVTICRGAALSQEEAAEILELHRRTLHEGGPDVLKDHRRSAVTRVSCGEHPLCVKEYKSRGWRDRLKDAVRQPRACRAWDGAQRLTEHGVSTPEPLAVLERGGTRFLVTRYIAGGVPLRELLAERFGGPLSPGERAEKRSLIRRLGHWCRSIHDLGLYHDDWSAKNILVVETADGWSFYLLDTESLAPGTPLNDRRRAKNLGQLGDVPAGASRTDKMRFLLAYADGDPALSRGPFVQAVLDFTRRRVQRRQRRRARERQ